MEDMSEQKMIRTQEVSVLMSIFRPNLKWLADQIRSVEKQINVDVSLNIRNDSLTNISIPIGDKSFNLEPSVQLGVGASYLTLLAESNPGGIAFCDQDDVWNELKLTMQVQALHGIERPALSYCDFEVVTSDLHLIKIRRMPKHITKFSFLFRNNVPGFSIYLNDEAREFLKESKFYLPEEGFHDWWTLLAISQIGICRRVPHVLASYRIHDSNTIGLSLTSWNRLKRIRKKMKSGFHESRTLIDQMIRFLEFANGENDGYLFLSKIVEGMKMNRVKRFQLLIREGILKSPFSEIVTVIFLYLTPKRITS
jgi:hypothetical protein